jgi:hypothetical protein
MTSAWPRAWLSVVGVVLLCGCPQSTSTSTGSAGSPGSAGSTVPIPSGKALATIHVAGMTERLELF